MKHIVRKLFMDYQKEEDYLNEMAANGLALVDYTFGRYVFELRHFKRIRSLSLFAALINLFIGIFNFYYGFFEVAAGIPPFNTYVSIVSFSVFTMLLIILILPLTRKINLLEKEKNVRE